MRHIKKKKTTRQRPVRKKKAAGFLTAKQTEFWKEKLFTSRAQVLESVKHIIEDENGTVSEVGDDIDFASNTLNREILFLLNDTDRQRLEDIDLALNKLKEGTFGVCENCGKKIAKPRLLVHPYARYCVHCKNQMEQPR